MLCTSTTFFTVIRCTSPGVDSTPPAGYSCSTWRSVSYFIDTAVTMSTTTVSTMPVTTSTFDPFPVLTSVFFVTPLTLSLAPVSAGESDEFARVASRFYAGIVRV